MVLNEAVHVLSRCLEVPDLNPAQGSDAAQT